MLTVGSLFSGIGGFDLGFERAGMRTSWFCEQDEFCKRVLAKHWPSVPCFGDITTLTNPPPIDLLCGGFPCQDISLAGRGAGITGARSGLWSEFARLIGELRPRYVVVENVSALRKKGLETVLADLVACGYDAEWDCIPASAVGAPHRRDRIWIVAYPGGEQHEGSGDANEGPPSQGLSQATPNMAYPDRGGRTRWPWPIEQENRRGQSENCGSHVPNPPGPGLEVGDGRQAPAGTCTTPLISDWWAVEPDVGRVANGVPARVDRLRSLGNALVPQIAQHIGEAILRYEASR